MAFTAAQVAVGATPTLVLNAGDDFPRLQVRNASATSSVFLGGPGVTTATGYELVAGASIAIHHAQDSSDDRYAVAAMSGTVHYLAY
jgi:hypothetical protein